MWPLLMLLIGDLGQPAVQASGRYHARPGEQLTIEVQFDAPAGVLFNRLAPTRVTLSAPFKTLELGPEAVTGETSDYEPETYFSKVHPLKFNLKVPATLKKGTHPLNLQAELFLCNTQQNLCYMKKVQVQGELKVGSTGKNEPMVLKVPRR